MIGRIIKGPVIGYCSACLRDIRQKHQHSVYEDELFCYGDRIPGCEKIWRGKDYLHTQGMAMAVAKAAMMGDTSSWDTYPDDTISTDDAIIRRYLSTRLPDTSNITLLREYDDIWRVEYDHNGTTHVLAVSKSVLEHREAVA